MIPGPTLIDLLDPLEDVPVLRGCQGAFLPLENTYGSLTVFNLRGRRHGAWTSTPNGRWESGRAGREGFGTMLIAGIAASLPITLATAYPFTLVVFAKVTSLRTSTSLSIGTVMTTMGQIGFVSDGTVTASASGGGTLSATSSNAYVANRFHCLGGVFDSTSSCTVYLNGIGTASTGSAPTGGTTVTASYLGTDPAASAFSNQQIESAWIWDRALSAGEMVGVWDQCERGYPDWLRRIDLSTMAGQTVPRPWAALVTPRDYSPFVLEG